MRRPRSKLQVSTFPFLAVLLCAMGALLFLLFIMDRRAKIAAKHGAAEVVAARKKRTEDEEKARQAEWEKARELLHQSLLEQQGQLLTNAKGLQANVADVNNKLAIVQSHHIGLEEKIHSETKQIALLQAQIAGQRAGLSEAEKKEMLSKVELIAAARELHELELAFQQLKALRAREKDVHSVVPYRGKQGDARTPVYVECIASGVLFHPDHKVLDGLAFTAEAMRDEVERRAGPLAIQKSIKDKSRAPAVERKAPYVLFLIRPDGIGTYYKAQAVLNGFQVDFGYEVVDAGWTLDFSGAPGAKGAPPVRFAKSGTPAAPGAPLAPPSFGGNSAGTTAPPGNPGSPTPGAGLPPIAGGPPGMVGTPPAPPGAPPGAMGGGTSGSLRPPVPMNPGDGDAKRGPAFVPIGKIPVGFPGSPGFAPGIGDTGTAEKAGQKKGPAQGGGLSPINAPIPGNSVGGNTAPPEKSDQKKGPTQGGGLSPINAPIPGNSVGGNTAPQEKSDAPGGMGPLPPLGPGTAVKPPSPPLSKLLGNRDFVITIECYTAHARITPSGNEYNWTPANAHETDKAFVQTVTTLITRRQASVRPGEPAYRPILRFHVGPDGQRTLLRAHALLEHLRIPMIRENVEE